MLEEIGNSKFMEWVAYRQLVQEAQEAANKASSSGGNSNKISLGSG